ncbi:hypothetical protein PISMIDRAFT_8388 [Pisolithus microcarpus 441]|uniref:Uncharacterized protein n=1 Tax=Pisolithus microcarpus 441 TaxID=765257 RepID=A0A0C9YQ35_9AGAM|nr:hypothetical protein PISMIDRAFT_8388 [Pisolithus microcarpus 441]
MVLRYLPDFGEDVMIRSRVDSHDLQYHRNYQDCIKRPLTFLADCLVSHPFGLPVGQTVRGIKGRKGLYFVSVHTSWKWKTMSGSGTFSEKLDSSIDPVHSIRSEGISTIHRNLFRTLCNSAAQQTNIQT